MEKPRNTPATPNPREPRTTQRRYLESGRRNNSFGSTCKNTSGYLLSAKQRTNSNLRAFIASGIVNVHHRAGGQSHACLSWSWHFLRRLWPGNIPITTRDGMHGFARPLGGYHTMPVCGKSRQLGFSTIRVFGVSPLYFISAGNVLIPLILYITNTKNCFYYLRFLGHTTVG